MSENTRLRRVGRVPFVDGVTRVVYEDSDGRQWVTGYDGERVQGVWLPPADEPVVFERPWVSSVVSRLDGNHVTGEENRDALPG
jgi:hypothetical protein